MTVKAKYKVVGVTVDQARGSNTVELTVMKAIPSTSRGALRAVNEENKEKIRDEKLRGGSGGDGGRGGGDPEKGQGGTDGVLADDGRSDLKDDRKDGDVCDGQLAEVVVVEHAAGATLTVTTTIPIPGSPGSVSSTTFVDEDKPLSKEEKKVHYKFVKNVMAARKIRELMNANVRETIRRRMEANQPRSFKIAVVAGVAIAIQIIVLVLIFI